MPHNRIILSGTLGTEEVWSTSLRFVSTGSLTAPAVEGVTDLSAWALDIRDQLADTMDILKNGLTGSGRVTNVVAQVIANDGTLTEQGLGAIASVAGAGTVTMPYQTSMVFSLITGIPGSRYRGRNYWPCIGGALTSAGRFQAPVAPEDMGGNFVDLAVMMRNAAPGDGARWVMFSPTRAATTPVVAVRTGNVPDTQRRRRDGLTETYVTSDVPGV